MTYQFQPGDRVKCAAWHGAFYTPGQVYVVEADGSLSSNPPRPLSYPLEQPFDDSRRFTLHAKAGEFAVGDKVVALHACPDTTAGKIYTAIERTSGNYVRWIDDRGEVNAWSNSHFRLAAPEEIAAAEKSVPAPAPTHKRGDTVLARITLDDDINENGEFYAGYLKAEAIVSLEAARPLTVGDRVTDSYLTGPIVFQQGSESVIDGDDGEGLVVRENIDLVLAQ